VSFLVKNNVYCYFLCLILALFLPILTTLTLNKKTELIDCSVQLKTNYGNYLPVNCDACDYVYPAERFQRLWWVENHIRQNRPAHIITVHYIGEILKKLKIPNLINTSFVDPKINSFTDCRKQMMLDWNRLLPFSLSYILLNVFLLGTSIYVMFLMIKDVRYTFRFIDLIIMAIILSVNMVVKSFFFTAHAQMFAFLSMVILIYVAKKILTEKDLPNTFFYRMSFLLGLLLLFYGSFIYVLPFLFLIEIIEKKATLFSLNHLKKWFLSMGLFSLPTILYILYLNRVGLKYHNTELHGYQQFVWVYWSILNNNFITTIIEKFNFFVKAFDFTNTAILVYLLSMLVITIKLKIFREYKYLFIISLFYLLFAFFLGYYKPRIVFILILPAIIIFFRFCQYLKSVKPNVPNYTYDLVKVILGGSFIYSVL